MSDSKNLNHKKPFINLTRLVIQTTSPMAIYSGGRELGFDNQLARDANNLPYIPASAIAGVWRHIVQSNYGEDTAKRWFGSNDNANQHASILQISNGDIHNSQNKPQNGIIDSQAIEGDELLALLVQSNPLKRERVSINDLGSANPKDKFDQILLPTGSRFTIDIRWSNSQAIDEEQYCDEWNKILECWNSVSFAFGSSTRNGLGRFKIKAKHDEKTCLQSDELAIEKINDFTARIKEPAYISEKQTYKNLLFEIELQASSTWRCGSSQYVLNKIVGEKDPQTLSYSEKIIGWDNKNIGRLSHNAIPILCGSSIKGIIAHRIAFHYNRHAGNWAEDMESDSPSFWATRNSEVDKLFGSKSDGEKGQAGLLMVPDCAITFNKNEVMHRTHNTINRFTGGVMPGALFTEELLYQPTFTIKAYILNNTLELSNEMKQAITDTIEDLKLGRLSIGSGTGRGTSLTKATGNNTVFNESLITIKPEETTTQENDDD